MIRTYPIDQVQATREIGGRPVMLSVLHYEAPRVFTPGREIERWAYDVGGEESFHFEDPRVEHLMSIYDKVNPMRRFSDAAAEVAERKRFARRGFYLLMAEGDVAGGIWVDDVNSQTGHADFHIVVKERYRGTGAAEFLLGCFEGDSAALARYGTVSCSFGPREDCDPAKFFWRQGYEVTGSREIGGSARKVLKKPD